MKRLTVALALLLTIPLMLGTVVIRRIPAGGFPACPECTFWFSGQNCGTSPNDSDGDDDCDNNDTSPIYTFDNGTYDYTADTTTSLSANNEPIIMHETLSTLTPDDPLATFTMSAENLSNGDYFVAENPSGSIQDGCEGRWMILMYQVAGDLGEEYMGTNTVGGDRTFFQVTGGGAVRGAFQVDYGSTTFGSISTTTLTDGRWWMIEGAFCEGSCATCTGMTSGDDSTEIWINGTSEDSDQDTSFTELTTGGGSNVNLGRIAAGNSGPQEFGVFAISNDIDVDFWDRYAGTCSEGTTRCVDDADCTGTCTNPAPAIEYPGAS